MAVAGWLFGCAGGAPKDVPSSAATIAVTDRVPATTSSCDEPSKSERQVVKPLQHLGRCTE